MSSKKISYVPHATVCCKNIDIELDGEFIRSVTFSGGCHGNTQGVAALIEGMAVDAVVAKLSGINCKGKGTSCPDQLAKALSLNK